MSLFASVPFFYDPTLNAKSAAKACPLSFSFGGTNPALQAFQASLADSGIFSLAMVYIDNSASPAPTKIVLAGTRQCIQIAGQSQGYIPLLASPEMLDFTIENDSAASGFTVNTHWLNIAPCEPIIWKAV